MPFRTTTLILATLCLLLAGCGRGPSAVPLYNEALTEFRAEKLIRALETAGRAAETGDEAHAVQVEFLRGSIKFGQCEIAAAQAASVEAEPFALEVAIKYGEAARDHWQRAAMGRPDWPEARRNVERALLKIEELTSKRKKPEGKKEPRPNPRLLPTPNPEEAVKPTPEPGGDPQLAELSPEEVARLFERLAEKEQEKRTLRRSTRATRTGEVERDW